VREQVEKGGIKPRECAMQDCAMQKCAMIWKLVVAVIAIWLGAAAPSLGQTAYPDKPIKIVNPFPPGSPVDFVGRLVAGKLEATLGQPAVVESRSGAGGTVGANSVAKSAPDGYTLLVTTPSTVATAPALYKSLPYDPVNDFAGIWGVNSGGLVMVVNPSLPVKTLSDFIRYARERPGQVTFASSGHGTTQHLAGELFQVRTGVKLLHVPYRGGAPATSDLMAGHVQVMFDALSNVYQNVHAGKLRALAILRGKRSALFPDLPTAAEAGAPGVETSGWVGIFAPSATPKDILGKLTGTLETTMRDPATVKRLMDAGNDSDFMVGEVLQKRLVKDVRLFAEIVDKAGIEKQ
jgi:tripartite-type tricarboxylate transporter receptor subunit TctC